MARVILVLMLCAFLAATLVQGGPAASAQSTPSATATVVPPGPTSTPPSPPAGSETPPPASTPWPAPANLRVTTVSRLLDDAGRPLPPEQQEHTDVLTWDHTPGLQGEYEVEVTRVPLAGGSPSVLPPYIRFPSERGQGTVGRVSQHPEWLNYQRCYRIRITVPSGTFGIEVGPFGQPACTVKPPMSGPGAPPAPPDTGSGNANGEAHALVVLGGGLVALAAASAGVVALGAARRPRNR